MCPGTSTAALQQRGPGPNLSLSQALNPKSSFLDRAERGRRGGQAGGGQQGPHQAAVCVPPTHAARLRPSHVPLSCVPVQGLHGPHGLRGAAAAAAGWQEDVQGRGGAAEAEVSPSPQPPGSGRASIPAELPAGPPPPPTRHRSKKSGARLSCFSRPGPPQSGQII